MKHRNTSKGIKFNILVILLQNFPIPRNENFGGSSKTVILKTRQVTLYFKGLDQMRRTVDTRALYLNSVYNGSSTGGSNTWGIYC